MTDWTALERAAQDNDGSALLELCTRPTILALIAELREAQGIRSAHEAVTRAIVEAVGDGDPSGPYWEDAVAWLKQRAEQAVAEAARLRELREEERARHASLLAIANHHAAENARLREQVQAAEQKCKKKEDTAFGPVRECVTGRRRNVRFMTLSRDAVEVDPVDGVRAYRSGRARATLFGVRVPVRVVLAVAALTRWWKAR